MKEMGIKIGDLRAENKCLEDKHKECQKNEEVKKYMNVQLTQLQEELKKYMDAQNTKLQEELIKKIQDVIPQNPNNQGTSGRLPKINYCRYVGNSCPLTHYIRDLKN